MKGGYPGTAQPIQRPMGKRPLAVGKRVLGGNGLGCWRPFLLFPYR